MKRTSVILSEATAARLHQMARANGVSQAELIREAIESRLEAEAPRRELSFIGIGEGERDDARRVDEILEEVFEERDQAREC